MLGSLSKGPQTVMHAAAPHTPAHPDPKSDHPPGYLTGGLQDPEGKAL